MSSVPTIVHDLLIDLPGRADRYIPDLYDLAHVAGREPYNLHDLAYVSWVGLICTVQILHNMAG